MKSLLKNNEGKRLVSAEAINVDGKVSIEFDSKVMTAKALTSVEANDKGNRTICYEKWLDEESGLTIQLTAYITNSEVDKRVKEYKEQEALRIKDENESLKLQVAQFQTLMNTPEFQEMLKKLGK